MNPFDVGPRKICRTPLVIQQTDNCDYYERTFLKGEDVWAVATSSGLNSNKIECNRNKYI